MPIFEPDHLWWKANIFISLLIHLIPNTIPPCMATSHKESNEKKIRGSDIDFGDLIVVWVQWTGSGQRESK